MPCLIARRSVSVAVVLAAIFAPQPESHGQNATPDSIGRLAPNVIVPQRHVFAPDRHEQSIEIERVDAKVAILEQIATVTLDIRVRNKHGRAAEAELLVPVPDGAVVRGFDFEGKGSEPSARILPKEEARRIYERIVAQTRDPALLEFVGYNVVRSSVFPVNAGGTQTIRLTYENVLPSDGPRVDFELPRSESLDATVPWSVSVRMESKSAIATVYSPTHDLDIRRETPNVVSVSAGVAGGGEVRPAAPSRSTNMQPGSFRLSYLLERSEVTASLFAYPDPSAGGGYFLLLAGLPATPPTPAEGKTIRRELTLVIDCSGSMSSGGKFSQAIAAARQVLNGLDDGEAFNIIAYNDSVSPMSSGPIAKTPETLATAEKFLTALKAVGGTNIHDALLEALRPAPTPESLPIVLFLTDGLPTVGQTSEVAIRRVATDANPAKRRVFSFGVGYDVNAPLLQKLASVTRGSPVFVSPGEDVEVKVGQVFRRMSGAILASPELVAVNVDGSPAQARVLDVQPGVIPDVFTGDQIVVLGRYLGDTPLKFRLSGNYLGKPREFAFEMPLTSATTRNSFVPRLWASRKIGTLIEAIQTITADTNGQKSPEISARVKELSDEIVRLSKEFGILTEYTAFLAEEGTRMDRPALAAERTADNARGRIGGARSGKGGINQAENSKGFQAQTALKKDNRYLDSEMKEVTNSNIQQLSDRTMYRRNNRWVDARVVERELLPPTKTIEFGTSEFETLLTRLVVDNRQSVIAFSGEVLIDVDGDMVLVKLPTTGE